MNEWKAFNITDYYEISSGLSKPASEFGEGNPFLSFKDVFWNFFVPDNLTELVKTNSKEQEKCSVKKGDVFLTRTSEKAEELGLSSVALRDYPNATFNGFTKRLRPKFKDKLDPIFVGYYLRSSKFRDDISAFSNLITRASLNNDALSRLKIYAPEFPEQKKIGQILYSYNQLIENNLKRIKLLEEIAQRTYEDWFVKFRINGKQLKLNKETGLPEGWEEKELGKIITKLESGSRPKGGIDKELKYGIPSVGAESVLGLGQYNYGKEKLILESFYEKMNRGKVEQKDILVYKDGAYIGKTSMFQDEFPHKICVVNEHVFLINTGDEDYQNYLFFTLNRPEYFQKMQSLNSNSAQPGINQEKLNSLIILVPKMDIIRKYSEMINPAVKEIFNLAKQNHLLRESRDILLPRLMSGVIEVGKK